MSDHMKQSSGDARRLLAEIHAQRLLSHVPITWDEVEELLPALNRREAARHLDGELQDPQRSVLFDILFSYHPGLREVLRPSPEVVSPPVIVLRRAESAQDAADVPLKLSAKPADPLSEMVVLETDDGNKIELFRHSRKGWHTVRFIGGRPAGAVTLFVDGVPIPWSRPLDGQGFGAIATDALTEFLNREAAMEMIVDDTSEGSDDRSDL